MVPALPLQLVVVLWPVTRYGIPPWDLCSVLQLPAVLSVYQSLGEAHGPEDLCEVGTIALMEPSFIVEFWAL